MGCHAPLRDKVADPLAKEGVTCDVCHTIREVGVAREGGVFRLGLEDNIKYAQYCDAKSHYFHRMGCSPVHEESRFCAACHLLYRRVEGGAELPVFTEYDEWLSGPYAAAGTDCQACHMPGGRAEVAAGSPPREGVTHHGFLAADGGLRRRALRLKAAFAEGTTTLAVSVWLKNEGAGHYVPTGMPGKRLILRVRTEDAEGREVARAERSYGRVLVDETGQEVPFYAAVRLAQDTRLAPKEVRTERFELLAPPRGQVHVEVLWRGIEVAVARALGQEPQADTQLLHVRAHLGRPGPGRVVPREVEVGP